MRKRKGASAKRVRLMFAVIPVSLGNVSGRKRLECANRMGKRVGEEY